MILFVTSACNLSCVFCDRRHTHAGFPGAEEIVSSGKRMDEKVVMVGGEPMLHPDLPDLIRKLRTAGAAQIVLQSNGLRAAYPSYAMKLESCGLDRASILFPAPGPSVADRLTRRPGAYYLALRGIRNLQESGVPVSLRLPLLQPALKHLPDLLRHVTAAVPGVRAIDLVHVHTGGPRLQVRFDELAGTLPSCTDGSFSGLPRVRLDTAGGMPLCVASGMPVFEPAEESLPGPRTYGRACGKCSLRRRCPGIPDPYLAAFGPGEFKPFRDGRSPGRRRADAAAGREGKPDKGRKYTKEETLKTVSTTYRCSESADGKEELYSVRLRVTQRCNQGCRFCFTPWEPKIIDEAGVEPVIISSIEAGAKKVVLTGGEPTLHANLAGLVRTARRAGAERVELQTNGIRLEDRDFCAELIDAGLTSVTVSLPSHRAKMLERITEESGTLKKTLKGIANLVDTGIPTSIHHVICPQNHRDVPGFARFITRRFRINHLSILLAAPIKPPLARPDIIVRFSDAAPWIKEALDYCIASDVPFEGTWERCGLPLCILKGDPRYYHGASRIPDANRTQDFIDAPGCPTCARRSLCYRVRRLYASLYGMEEFQPVHEHEVSSLSRPSLRPAGK